MPLFLVTGVIFLPFFNAVSPDVVQVIQSPFSNGDSPTSDNQSGETRFTYFPTSAVATDPTVITQQTESTLANANPAGGKAQSSYPPHTFVTGLEINSGPQA